MVLAGTVSDELAPRVVANSVTARTTASRIAAIRAPAQLTSVRVPWIVPAFVLMLPSSSPLPPGRAIMCSR